jgi:hypothetical protein
VTSQTPGRRPAWVDDELFPFASRFLHLDGHTIHYVDEGHGPLLLLYHGNPTWSFLYRHRDGARLGRTHRAGRRRPSYCNVGQTRQEGSLNARAAAPPNTADGSTRGALPSSR